MERFTRRIGVSLLPLVLALQTASQDVQADGDPIGAAIAEIRRSGGIVEGSLNGVTGAGLNISFSIEAGSAPRSESGLRGLKRLSFELGHVSSMFPSVSGRFCFSLLLEGRGVGDSSLSLLEDLDRLSELDIRTSSVTDRGLVHLSGLKSLTTLRLTECQVTDAGLDNLGRLENLESLDFQGNRMISGEGFLKLRNLRNLRRLRLKGESITDHGMACISQLRGLRVLGLHPGTSVSDGGLVYLSRLSQLQRLEISDSHIKGTGFEAVAHGGSLTSLSLQDVGITDFGMTKLCSLGTLQELTLIRAHELHDKGLADLGKLTGLRKLRLIELEGLTGIGLASFSTLPHLSYLELSGPNFTDSVIDKLGGLKCLETLRLVDTSVTDHGVKRLQNMIKFLVIVRVSHSLPISLYIF